MRVLLTHDSWSPALAETFITKDDLATNRDYGFRFNSGSTGKLQFVASPDGVTTFPNADNVTGGYSVVSTAATGFAPGSTHWVRVTRSASTGQIKFYTSDDYDASTNTGTWTQLGDTIAAPKGLIHDGAPTSVLQVGSRIAPAGSDNPLKGTIYYADVRKVIDGTGAAVVAKFDPSADAGLPGAASFTSSSSAHETWTLSGTAAIVAGNPQDEITKTSYDALGRVTQIVDAEGHTELFGYDRSTNNVTFHQDKNGNVTTYEYDAVGNKVTERLPISSTLSDLGWQGAQSIETTNNFVFLPQIASDPQGNATVIWLQGDAAGQALYANRYTAATHTWQGPQAIATSTSGIAPEVAIDAQGNAIAVWEQSDGIYAGRYLAGTGTWQATQRLSTSTGAKPQIVIDAQGNATAIWQQSNGLVNNIYANRYIAATGTWQGAQLIESNDATSANFPQLAVDSNGNAIAVWQQGGVQANRYVAATGTWRGRITLGRARSPTSRSSAGQYRRRVDTDRRRALQHLGQPLRSRYGDLARRAAHRDQRQRQRLRAAGCPGHQGQRDNGVAAFRRYPLQHLRQPLRSRYGDLAGSAASGDRRPRFRHGPPDRLRCSGQRDCRVDSV
jgi:YD repeat-containing protein